MTLDGVLGHRSRELFDADLTTRLGVPSVTAARALVDVSGSMRHEDLGKALDDLLRRKLCTLDEVRRCVAPPPPRARATAARYAPACSRSAGRATTPARATSRLVRFAPSRGPACPCREQQYRMRLAGKPVRIDLAYPELRIAIEVDSWEYHGQVRSAFDVDHIRRDELDPPAMGAVHVHDAPCPTTTSSAAHATLLAAGPGACARRDWRIGRGIVPPIINLGPGVGARGGGGVRGVRSCMRRARGAWRGGATPQELEQAHDPSAVAAERLEQLEHPVVAAASASPVSVTHTIAGQVEIADGHRVGIAGRAGEHESRRPRHRRRRRTAAASPAARGRRRGASKASRPRTRIAGSCRRGLARCRSDGSGSRGAMRCEPGRAAARGSTGPGARSLKRRVSDAHERAAWMLVTRWPRIVATSSGKTERDRAIRMPGMATMQLARRRGPWARSRRASSGRRRISGACSVTHAAPSPHASTTTSWPPPVNRAVAPPVGCPHRAPHRRVADSGRRVVATVLKRPPCVCPRWTGSGRRTRRRDHARQRSGCSAVVGDHLDDRGEHVDRARRARRRRSPRRRGGGCRRGAPGRATRRTRRGRPGARRRAARRRRRAPPQRVAARTRSTSSAGRRPPDRTPGRGRGRSSRRRTRATLRPTASDPDTEPITTNGVPPLNTRSPVNSTLRSGTHATTSFVVCAGPMCCSATSRSSTHTDR